MIKVHHIVRVENITVSAWRGGFYIVNVLSHFLASTTILLQILLAIIIVMFPDSSTAILYVSVGHIGILTS